MNEPDRQRAIREKLARMGAQGALFSQSPVCLPTGFSSLDAATGGLPRGFIIELFGAAGTGKTTLALQIAANLQSGGMAVAWIDAERSFDAGYAAGLGLALDRLAVAQPDSAEAALEIARTLALSGAVDLVVVDSAAALTPGVELAAGIGTSGAGIHSRVLASGLRRLGAALRRSGAAALFLNQTRGRLQAGAGEPLAGRHAGSGGRAAFDGSEVAAGGPPLKLFAAVRIALAGMPAQEGRLRFRVLKNRAGGGAAEGQLSWRNEAGFAQSP